jgi:capsular exopolysaccharide synthesis family protein
MQNSQNEVRIRDVFIILKNHILLILFFMILAFALSSIYLFFTPPTYSANGSIEVITYDKGNRETNDLLQNTFYANKEVDKEIEKLTTYEINKRVIKNMNLSTQFFIKNRYREREIYGDEVPIKVTNIHNVNDFILTRLIKFIPLKDGYRLEIEPTFQEKLSKILFKKEPIKFNSDRVFPYNKPIKTEYFEFIIKRVKNVTKPIYLKLNGDNRYIYETLIKNRLFVGQKNRNAPIVDIVYHDNIPKRATEYVNRLIEIFQNEGRIQKSKRNNLISDFIKKELAKNSKELKDAEEALERYRIKNRAIKISTQTDLIIKSLNNIEVSISDNHLKNIMVDNILDLIRRGKKIDSITPFLIDLKDSVNISLIKSLQDLELKENKLSLEYTDEYPDLVIVREQIDILKDKIRSNLANLKKSLLAKKANLEKLKRKKERELKRLPIDETNMVNLDRRYKLLLQMNEYLSQKEKENDTIKAAIISDYKIVERAYLPKIPIKPKGSLIKILALLTGLLIGVVLSLLHNSFSDKLKSIEDIEKLTKIFIYGTIPNLKRNKRELIEVFKHSKSPFSNSLRVLRTNLQFASNQNSSTVILITSNHLKDGKSITVANLGAILQLANYKVVIIDLDLHNPSIHKYFNIDCDAGISGYLMGKYNMSDIIFSTAYHNLDIIPVGTIPSNPSEIILSKRIEIMLSKLRERYDYILIDTVQLSSLTDTLHLMKYADINLVIFKLNSVKKVYIEKLERIIHRYRLQNIGLIINGVHKDKIKDIYI